ncbi:MAG: chitotriosidase-like [Polyangiaceae bacterium]|nr:chitotriosidase-like [Polyangiaceae bacterium]
MAMRAFIFSAALLSACVSPAAGPSNTPDSEPSASGGDTKAASAPEAAGASTPVSTGPKKIVGYFTNWAQYRTGCKFTAADVDASLLTHINYAFAKVDAGPGGKAKPRFGIAAYDKTDLGANGQYAQINGLKKKHPDLKTFISIGGWSHNEGADAWLFTTMAEKAETRADFIKATIEYVRLHHFDGIDLDWEYPADPTRGGRSIDTATFTALLTEFRAAINAEAKASGKDALLLTIAAPAGVAVRGLDLAKIHEPLDWINLMSYDYYGGWDVHTNHNAPAPKVGAGVQGSVSIYMNFGVPAEKIVLGMATYGRSFANAETDKVGALSKGNGPVGRCTGAPGMLSYFEIKELLDAGKLKASWDDAAMVPYAYDSSSKLWVSYDDERSFGKKLDFIDQKGLGGAMFWALDMDDYKHGYPLISTVAKRYKK